MSKRALPSLRALRTFSIAAEHESFRVAGEELFITASAVSHQVKSLEEELGEQLFERTSRSLRLTETGRSLYAEIAPLMRQIDEVVARYKKGGVALRSSVRISVQPFFANEYFVPRLQEFNAAHPDIDIQVGASDESSEKHPADADLSIRLFRSAPQGLVSDLLFPLRLVPAGSPELARGVKVRNKTIVSEFPIIIHDTRPQAWKRWSAASGISLPEDARVTRLDTMTAAARAAERGVGAAMMPVGLGDKWFESGGLVRLFDYELQTDVSYYLVCPGDRAADPAVSTLRSWILQTFAQKG
ncbi:MAG: LysR family transcriptional regulator [Gammaproteobacteria bacterium]|nr:LysR family transcriptional regulator [Gammaproteobacteria bacterium]NNF60691.1 LysR family transcriptional regulator [Gammaproteobacteria bacterium]NNM19831.1 LysR family transcriptional regulator [Gammaproteobacteria bacterium]